MRRKRYISCIRLSYNISAIFLIITLISYVKYFIHKAAVLSNIPVCGNRFLSFKQSWHPSLNATELKDIFEKYNEAERILNLDKFGPITENTVVIVVSQQRSTESLKYFLVSLCDLRGIEDTLLVFSHNHFDKNVNQLIESIDFCRVVQIFYPLSLQVYTNDFPGTSLNDCPQYINYKTAMYLNCTGASHPDIHGRYRAATIAEKKHHWWWTANWIFENLRCTKNNNGIVVFTQDVHFLTDDFLYILLHMKKIADSLPQCDFLSLGTYSSYAPNNNTFRLDFTTWDPSVHSSVFAFDVSVWNSIVSHYDQFCLVDDSSWARSLFYVSLNRKDGKRFKVLSSSQPRALRIPITNNHWWMLNSGYENILQLLDILNILKNHLFPPFLETYTDIELEDDEYIIFDVLEGDGGWSDPRDHELCNNITLSKVKKILLDMKSDFKDPKNIDLN